MTEILILILKTLIIAAFALYLGKKTGLFSLGSTASACVLILLLILCGAEIYSAFFRDDISLLIIFRSSFLNLTLDLSFGLRIFLITLLLGLLCSMCKVRFTLKTGGVRQMCILAMLIALAVLFAVYGTFRIGSGIKISVKFIPVFIAATLFGPLWGAMVGALSDIIAFVVNPVGGALIPQITLVEFLYGFTYGLFFANVHSWSGAKTALKTVLVVIFHILVLNLALTSYFLAPILNMDYRAAIVTRAPSGLVNMALQLVGLFTLARYISAFRKMVK